LDKIESKKRDSDIEVKLKPLDERILNQYIQMPNKWFLDEYIDVQTQKEFKIGFDLKTERITIPVYDEVGSLVGCSGRATKPEDEEQYKYFPLYNYPKSKICYGLYKTYPYIKYKNECIIFEGQKSVQKAWSYEQKNSIACGQLIPSKDQMEKILRLNCDLVFNWDTGLKKEEWDNIKEFLNKYKIYTNIYVIYDKWNLLGEKMSAVDQGKDIWFELYNKKILIN